MARKRKVILVVSEDWYFLSHRLELARYFVTSGWEVIVATQVNSSEGASLIRQAGLRLEPLPLERGRLLSLSDLSYWWKLVRLYRREDPDVVHHVAMKPVLYGSLAAIGARRTGVVNSLAGLGYLFSNARGVALLVAKVVFQVFRALFARTRTRVILQNAEDMEFFHRDLGVPWENLRLVRGAGLDLARYSPVVHGLRKEPVVVMVSRVLRDKGVVELVEAARLLTRKGVAARVLLVGGLDSRNPNSFTTKEMEKVRAEGWIEWLGHRTDVTEIYGGADIAVLPSYREGLPQSLLEAAASGLPIVTTDTSGCREIVNNGVNGFLVPVRDAAKLAEAIERLILDATLRASMGAASRQRAECEFRQESIMKHTAAVYEEVATA